MNWSKSVSRKELAEVLRLERLPDATGLREFDRGTRLPGRQGDIELVWKQDPREGKCTPSAIIVDREDERDLLAWISTYVPSVRPLSAYTRVCDRDMASQFGNLKSAPHFGVLEDACLGLILGETATYVATKRELRQMTHNSSLSTLSFVVARGAGFGLSAEKVDELATKWLQARTFIRGTPLPVSAQQVQAGWSVIRHAAPGNDFKLPLWEPVSAIVLDACSQILRKGDMDEGIWISLTKDLPDLTHLRADLTGPREERLSLFEKTINAIRNRTFKKSANAEFFCAYLASSISPGTLDHVEVLLPYLDVFPSLLIWYGLCAGLSSRGTLLDSLNGLARRLKRELTREADFLETPSCDIGFAELEILSTSVKEWGDLRTVGVGQIVVELLPCINAHYRMPRVEEAPARTSAEGAKTLNELEALVERMRDSLRRARREGAFSDQVRLDFDRHPKRKSEK
jgi:hypothetical protein